MTIIHDTYTMPVVYHGMPSEGTFNRPHHVHTWWGVKGALVLVGNNQVRELSLDATITNWATWAQFRAVKDSLCEQMSKGLKGDLKINGSLYKNALFLGWETTTPVFFDGSGVHGWTEMGRLKWLQTA